jgi:hypothetical protein
MGSINQLVSVLPGVLAVGGSNLALTGMVLTENTRAPIGAVVSLPTAAAVAAYFGANSTEAIAAPYYFNGYDNSSAKPGAMKFYQTPYAGAVSAYIRGGSVAANALATLQSVTNGSFNITIDGYVFSPTNISLTPGSGGTSYSAIAGIITTALGAVGAVPVQASFTASIAVHTMTVTGTPTGAPLAVGQAVLGAGVAANTIITGLGTGTGEAGTYIVTPSQTVSSEAMTTQPQLPTMAFDSTSNAFTITSGSTGVVSTMGYASGLGTAISSLNLTQATGATLSQGAAQVNGSALTAYLSGLLAVDSNWAGLSYTFEPTLADKVIIAQFINNTPGDQLWFSMWDSGQTMFTGGDTASAGAQIEALNLNGTLPICYDAAYSTSAALLATGMAALGMAASINFSQKNGRTRLAGRTQAGLATTVSNTTNQTNANANGYSFYGQYAGQGNNYNQFQSGAISGAFTWWDEYIDQIWFNNACQVALAACLMQQPNLPYNQPGYDTISHYLYNGVPLSGSGVVQTPSGPVAAALNFGAINTGIPLSSSQISALQAAGVNVSSLANNGFYILVADPGPTVRSQRGSPICAVYYTDGGQIQKIVLFSIDVQ